MTHKINQFRNAGNIIESNINENIIDNHIKEIKECLKLKNEFLGIIDMTRKIYITVNKLRSEAKSATINLFGIYLDDIFIKLTKIISSVEKIEKVYDTNKIKTMETRVYDLELLTSKLRKSEKDLENSVELEQRNVNNSLQTIKSQEKIMEHLNNKLTNMDTEIKKYIQLLLVALFAKKNAITRSAMNTLVNDLPYSFNKNCQIRNNEKKELTIYDQYGNGIVTVEKLITELSSLNSYDW